MRRIGKVPKEQVAVFANFLRSRGLEVAIRHGDQDDVELWAEDEDKIDAAKDSLQVYLADPTAEQFQRLPTIAPTVKKTNSRYIDVRTQIFHRPALKAITTALIAISVLVFIARQALPSLDALLIYSAYAQPLFKEIRAGEVWRLLTPIFLHFNLLHIIFSMLWLHVLGSQLEQREGGKYLLLLVVAIGIISNTCQYLMAASIFGGFSGVVYGLLGYVWIMGKFKPRSGYILDNFTLGFMLVWLFMGIIGMVGNIASAAHVFGFISGVVWGLIVSDQLVMRRNNRRTSTRDKF
ncbi:MAG: rhomboid family intramembrane serine protease [Pseudomonadota bacterium]|nr:rhomboid family intramembrane serine protease [Pseudomonadota bacterium]